MAGSHAIKRAGTSTALRKPVAYFSMEFALHKSLPIYAGGLGVLAGDVLKSAADKGLNMVGVGLLYREGYHDQKLNRDCGQVSNPVRWDPEKVKGLIRLDKSVKVAIEGRDITFRLWRYDVVGRSGSVVPLILLDSYCPENRNNEGFIDITRRLYKNHDSWWRITQEMALGIGGMRALNILYPGRDFNYHLNEGHAAFAPLEYMRCTFESPENMSTVQLEEVRSRFTCTTHTPVPAGHDRFYIRGKMDYILPFDLLDLAQKYGRDPDNPGMVNMSNLMMNLSRRINAVSKLHLDVTKRMFPGFAGKMCSITNGVHPFTWISPEIAGVLDVFHPGWREDPGSLGSLTQLCQSKEFRDGLWNAHQETKKRLIDEVNRRNPELQMDENALTIGFARRAAGYKRADLIFTDLEKLMEIVNEVSQSHGSVQVIFAGKAHYEDGIGEGIIKHMLAKIGEVNAKGQGKIKVVYLENHDMELGQLMVSGSDVWLNTPLPPFEASGTSGMKAALNGVPQISTWDGWWPEGYHGGAAGWTFGLPPNMDQNPHDGRYGEDSLSLYATLQNVAALYFTQRDNWITMMINAISLNGSYFNTHRMVDEYTELWES